MKCSTLTTKDVAEAEENLVLRIYPAADLGENKNLDSLIKVITVTVAPNSWKSCGTGQGVVVGSGRNLVICQTREVHDRVLKLLRAMRATNKL